MPPHPITPQLPTGMRALHRRIPRTWTRWPGPVEPLLRLDEMLARLDHPDRLDSRFDDRDRLQVRLVRRVEPAKTPYPSPQRGRAPRLPGERLARASRDPMRDAGEHPDDRDNTVAVRLLSAVRDGRLRIGVPYSPRGIRSQLGISMCHDHTRLALDLAARRSPLKVLLVGAESTALSGHRVGWRKGNWTAKPLSKWTWEKIVAALQAAPKPIRERYLRTKVEANKEALHEDRENADALKPYGVRFVQERRFYLHPAREGQPELELKA